MNIHLLLTQLFEANTFMKLDEMHEILYCEQKLDKEIGKAWKERLDYSQCMPVMSDGCIVWQRTFEYFNFLKNHLTDIIK